VVSEGLLTTIPIAPVITSIDPFWAGEGGSGFTLTVTGSGFNPGSCVRWNGENRPTLYINPTELRAEIPAEDIQSAHEVPFVTVANQNVQQSGGLVTEVFGTRCAMPPGGDSAAQDAAEYLPVGNISNGLPFFITFTGAAVTGYDMMYQVDDPSAAFGDVSAAALGNGTLIVAQYASNPAPGAPLIPTTNQYYDVHAATPNTFTEVTIHICGTGFDPEALLFWDGTNWVAASNQSIDLDGCVLVVVNDFTVPSLADLSGGLFTTVNIGASDGTSFADVPPSHWAWMWIKRLAAAGVTDGCGLLQFCPDDYVTRAEMAKFLLKSQHGETYEPPTATAVFADVPTTHWAAAWVDQLYQEGITAGCAVTPLRYCPDAFVTRAEMAKFLLLAKYGAAYTPPAVGAATGFADVPTSHWAAAWIKQLAAEGITTITAGGNYLPEERVTRAEMAKFLVLTFDLP
jgi:hypothetical protein